MKTHEKTVRNHLAGYWVGVLAATLERITKTTTLKEAKEEARESLLDVSDRQHGMHGLHADIRRRWREAALGEDDDE